MKCGAPKDQVDNPSVPRSSRAPTTTTTPNIQLFLPLTPKTLTSIFLQDSSTAGTNSVGTKRCVFAAPADEVGTLLYDICFNYPFAPKFYLN